MLIVIASIGGIIIILLVVCVTVVCLYMQRKRMEAESTQPNPIEESNVYDEYDEIEDIVCSINNERNPSTGRETESVPQATGRIRTSYQSIRDVPETDHAYLDINEKPAAKAWDVGITEEERQNYQQLSRKGMTADDSYIKIKDKMKPKTKKFLELSKQKPQSRCKGEVQPSLIEYKKPNKCKDGEKNVGSKAIISAEDGRNYQQLNRRNVQSSDSYQSLNDESTRTEIVSDTSEGYDEPVITADERRDYQQLKEKERASVNSYHGLDEKCNLDDSNVTAEERQNYIQLSTKNRDSASSYQDLLKKKSASQCAESSSADPVIDRRNNEDVLNIF